MLRKRRRNKSDDEDDYREGCLLYTSPVSFDPNDPEKDAQLFFTLASCNPDQHLNNMMRLSEMLMNEELVAELLKAEGPEDLLKLQEKYLDK